MATKTVVQAICTGESCRAEATPQLIYTGFRPAGRHGLPDPARRPVNIYWCPCCEGPFRWPPRHGGRD